MMYKMTVYLSNLQPSLCFLVLTLESIICLETGMLSSGHPSAGSQPVKRECDSLEMPDEERRRLADSFRIFKAK